MINNSHANVQSRNYFVRLLIIFLGWYSEFKSRYTKIIEQN